MMWPWKISMFGAGEKAGGFGSLTNPIERQIHELGKVATNKYVAALAQLDYEKSAAFRFVLDPQKRFWPINIGEINTGDSLELINFMAWSEATCPAQHNIMIISGHGLAWQDKVMGQFTRAMGVPNATKGFFSSMSQNLFGIDKKMMVQSDTALMGIPENKLGPLRGSMMGTRAVLPDSSGDFIANQELKQAVGRISDILTKPLDIVVFDACLLSSMELLYELVGKANFAVASVDELSAKGMNIAGLATAISKLKGKVAPAECTRLMCKVFRPGYNSDSCVGINLNQDDWEKVKELMAVISSQIMDVMVDQDAKESIINIFKDSIQSLKAYNKKENIRHSGLSDISTMARTVIASKDPLINTGIKDHFKSLLQLVERRLVVAATLGKHLKESKASGVSIFSPINRSQYNENSKDYAKLDFSIETKWNQVLYKLYKD
ncbi:MAG: clostripain-related cysteine peptidase [Flavobacteriaceae bacterium]